MKTIALDFEAYFRKGEYSVKELGNWRYTHAEEFDPFLVSVTDGADSWVGHPRDLDWSALEGAELVAHNASFERAICARLAEQGKAPVLDNLWHCTANLTSFIGNARSLADALWVLERRKLSKTIRDDMSGKTWEDIAKLGQADAYAEYCRQDTIETFGLWQKYGPRWPQFERDLSELTMRQCARGVAINTELLREYTVILQEVIFNLVKSFPWTARGAKPTSPIAIAEECRNVGIPAPPVKTHDEEGFEQWVNTYRAKYPWVQGAGRWRSLTRLLSTLERIKERLRPDDTIDFSLLYFGGHTGRWSGGGSGLNMQNFKKIPLFIKDGCYVEPPMLRAKEFAEWAKTMDHALDIRKLFIPRPGKKFILADLAQIEPRVLAWLTGNTELLDMIRGGMAIYEAFARLSMGWTGGDLKKEDPDKYQLSKIQVLGLGYGCGAEKFITIAAGYDVALTSEQSQKLVLDFRMSNPKITALWKKLDDNFRASVNGNYEMELPSGRVMTYRNVLRQTKPKRVAATGEWRNQFVYTAEVGPDRDEFYGGVLTENVTQAVARDVFGVHLLELEKQCGDVIFHIHDEAVTEVEADVTKKDVEAVMSRTPEWLEGCPIAAEAKEAPHYLK